MQSLTSSDSFPDRSLNKRTLRFDWPTFDYDVLSFWRLCGRLVAAESQHTVGVHLRLAGVFFVTIMSDCFM